MTTRNKTEQRIMTMRRLAPAALFAVILMAGASVLAQPAAVPMIANPPQASFPAPQQPASSPPGAVPSIIHDAAKTTPGHYVLDGSHAALFGKVTHNLTSWGVFRFGKVEGALDWDPAHPEKSKLSLTVHTADIWAGNWGDSGEVKDQYYLNVDKFPTATFVSTGAKATGPGKGRLTGNMTIFGVTQPMTFDVTFTGAGTTHEGNQAIGFNAQGSLDRTKYGWTTIPALGNIVRLEMDAEFDKTPVKG